MMKKSPRQHRNSNPWLVDPHILNDCGSCPPSFWFCSSMWSFGSCCCLQERWLVILLRRLVRQGEGKTVEDWFDYGSLFDVFAKFPTGGFWKIPMVTHSTSQLSFHSFVYSRSKEKLTLKGLWTEQHTGKTLTVSLECFKFDSMHQSFQWITFTFCQYISTPVSIDFGPWKTNHT